MLKRGDSPNLIHTTNGNPCIIAAVVKNHVPVINALIEHVGVLDVRGDHGGGGGGQQGAEGEALLLVHHHHQASGGGECKHLVGTMDDKTVYLALVRKRNVIDCKTRAGSRPSVHMMNINFPSFENHVKSNFTSFSSSLVSRIKE